MSMDWEKLARWHSRFRTAQTVSGSIEAVSTAGYSAADSVMAVRDFGDDVTTGVEWWEMLEHLTGADEDGGEDACHDASPYSDPDPEGL